MLYFQRENAMHNGDVTQCELEIFNPIFIRNYLTSICLNEFSIQVDIHYSLQLHRKFLPFPLLRLAEICIRIPISVKIY